jgi:hypothetical protein
MTFFEVCKVSDKAAEFFVRANERNGLMVIKGRKHPKQQETYFVVLDNTKPYRNAEFKSIPDGLYVFDKNNQPVLYV